MDPLDVVKTRYNSQIWLGVYLVQHEQALPIISHGF
ncbi:hypothetical protein BVZ79_00672 [Haemophilus influenzae]|nr:hypothetical protein BVZ79_00672 [Haemophilus influenzae]